MQVSVLNLKPLRGRIELLELHLLPRLVQQHGASQLRHQLNLLLAVLLSLSDHKRGLLLLLNQFPALEVLDILFGDGLTLPLRD